MYIRRHFYTFFLAGLLLLGCETVEKSAPTAPQERQESGSPPPEEAAPEEVEAEPETTKPAPPDQLLPQGVFLVDEGNRLLRRSGDFDGDGEPDEAFLGVTGSRVTAEALKDEKRLYGSPTVEGQEGYALIRLAGGESLILPVGELFLLAEFDTLSLTPDREQPKGELLYLRLETREQQRHLLISVNPEGPSLQRYLFLTDSLTGFFYRDVDNNGEVEIVHVENQVTPAGVEESYYTLYQLIGQRLERRSRTPVVEKTNDLLLETRRLLSAGETTPLLSRYATDPTLAISAYFEVKKGMPIEQVSGPEFVYVPELRSNPFDLREEQPRLHTEILLLSEGKEHLYGLTLGLLIPPDGSPEVRILPTPPSSSF